MYVPYTVQILVPARSRYYTLQDIHMHIGGAFEPFFLIFSDSTVLIITEIRQAI